MLVCIIGLGFSSSSKYDTSQSLEEQFIDTLSNIPNEDSSSSSQVTSSILAIVFAILCPIGFCTGGVIVRIAHNGPKLGPDENYSFKTVNSTDISILANVFINFVFIILTIITYQTGSHAFYSLEYFQIASVGIIGSIGVVCMNRALIIGLSGPVFALCNTQVIIQTILNAIFIGQVPTVVEIVSAVIGIIGSCIIALFS